MVLTILCASAAPVFAADTLEPFGVGEADMEFYLGADGLGLARSERTIYADAVAGWGVLDRLSLFIGHAMQADGLLAGAESVPYAGLYGTPLDTEHVDLDLLLQVSVASAAEEGLHLAPSVELNWDADPEMSTWGLYLRFGFDVGGKEVGEGDAELHWHTGGTLGAYCHVGDGHQLLLEVDGLLRIRRGPDDHRTEFGGVALGYNVTLHDNLELITQVALDVPQSGEDLSAALMAGLIATIP